MFWIEESPTSAGDDDSDVPFDESPGKPMACEQEIELVIRPDDDHLYPSKALDADEDTWPETLSAYGGTTSTLVSDEAEKDSSSIVNNKDSSDAQDSSDRIEAEGDAEDSHSVASEPTDDDATQVMGEHHTIEGKRMCMLSACCFYVWILTLTPHVFYSHQDLKTKGLSPALKMPLLYTWPPRCLLNYWKRCLHQRVRKMHLKIERNQV